MPILPRVTAPLFLSRKGKQPLVVVTAYDAPQGRLADTSGVDAILVGDSVGMTVHGYDSTLPVTVDDIVLHTRAVARGQNAYQSDTESDTVRGARHALLIADLPFGSYGISIEDGVRAGVRLMQEAGAQAVKVEGATDIILETVRRLVSIGVPVMAHVGLTPQSVHQFGGFRVQGRETADGDRIFDAVQKLADAGAFGVVLELIPADLARRITDASPIPTIGIGAGVHCDGQVQVLHDILGLTEGRLPRHAHKFADLSPVIVQALRTYAASVRDHTFPNDANSF